MMKLSKLSKPFTPQALLAYADQMEPDFRTLEKFLPAIFPSADAVKQTVAQMDYKYGEVIPNNVYTAQFLPFHTQDHRWLTKYVARAVKGHQPKIKAENIQTFVLASSAFRQALDRYVQDVVKAQIQFLLTTHEPNGIMRDGRYQPHFLRTSSDSDKLFRLGVMDAMQTLNVDPHAAEVVLETNANLWRPRTMEAAFRNRYLMIAYNKREETMELMKTKQVSQEDLTQMTQTYKDIWLRLREYGYYQDHKAIIDELGTATDNMKISADAALDLNKQAIAWHQRYKTFTASLYASRTPTTREQ